MQCFTRCKPIGIHLAIGVRGLKFAHSQTHRTSLSLGGDGVKSHLSDGLLGLQVEALMQQLADAWSDMAAAKLDCVREVLIAQRAEEHMSQLRSDYG
jgi:hypothetical protein